MKLNELIKKIKYDKLINFENIEITGISYNSKTTKQGDIFICLTGEHTDGHEFFKQAEENGAKAFLTEKQLDTNLPQVLVDSARQKIADIADKFYDSPSKKLNLIGVTGTNGKTTVTHLVQKIFEENRQQCALIGTLGYKLTSNDEYKEAKHTTPQAPELQFTLDLIADKMKIPNCIMEVSSHALEQNRAGGCVFKGAVLTNLTQDHLDYHITMDNYFKAKSMLFKKLESGFAVINADDIRAKNFLDAVPKGIKILTYGIKNQADVMAKKIKFSISGAEFSLEGGKFGAENVRLQMNGMFSVYNVLAAVTTGLASGFSLKNCIKPLKQTKGVAGRFEIVWQNPLVIVDYAHTPDGLENVLKAAKEITSEGSDLICLFGCGGDRDATKRPKMGEIAQRLAHKVIITSDNPRSEDPQQIITDILAGFKSVTSEKVFVEADRAKAIALLKTICKNNDIIVIAGKGHEDYQILKDRTIHFDDREEAKRIFGEP